MKVAEALIERSALQNRIGELTARLRQYAKVQSGDLPPHDPSKLLRELGELYASLEGLIVRINSTNIEAKISTGITITSALARRDIIQQRRKALLNLAEASAIKQERYSKTEIKFEPTMNVKSLLKEADKLAKEHRELDSRIQEANWATDLLD